MVFEETPSIGSRHRVESTARRLYNIDAREFHAYAAEWTPDQVVFFIDDEHVKKVGQSPGYPMQLMLGLYEFPDDAGHRTNSGPYRKELVVDYVGGYLRLPD